MGTRMETATLLEAMMAYNAGDARRIAHFVKVHGYARAIGRLEALPPLTQLTLEAAAIVHDIGIRNSEARYGSAAGHHQEVEGPPEARAMMLALGYEETLVERVCWLVAHHHTYQDITGMDYRILVEADFLVNLEEGHVSRQGLKKVRQDMFRTSAGLRFFDHLFPRS